MPIGASRCCLSKSLSSPRSWGHLSKQKGLPDSCNCSCNQRREVTDEGRLNPKPFFLRGENSIARNRLLITGILFAQAPQNGEALALRHYLSVPHALRAAGGWAKCIPLPHVCILARRTVVVSEVLEKCLCFSICRDCGGPPAGRKCTWLLQDKDNERHLFQMRKDAEKYDEQT
jgi:hypothetical protein